MWRWAVGTSDTKEYVSPFLRKSQRYELRPDYPERILSGPYFLLELTVFSPGKMAGMGRGCWVSGEGEEVWRNLACPHSENSPVLNLHLFPLEKVHMCVYLRLIT